MYFFKLHLNLSNANCTLIFDVIKIVSKLVSRIITNKMQLDIR